MRILRPYLAGIVGLLSGTGFLPTNPDVGEETYAALLVTAIIVGAIAIWGWWGALPPRERRFAAPPTTTRDVAAVNPAVLAHQAGLQARLDAQLDSATAVTTSAADSWVSLSRATSPHEHLVAALRENGIWGSEFEPGVRIARWADDHTTVTLQAWDWDLATPLDGGGYVQMIRQRTLPWPGSSPHHPDTSHGAPTLPMSDAEVLHDVPHSHSDEMVGTDDPRVSRQSAPVPGSRYLARTRVAIAAAILVAGDYIGGSSLMVPVAYGVWWCMEGKNFWGYRLGICPRNVSGGERIYLAIVHTVTFLIAFLVSRGTGAPPLLVGPIVLVAHVTVGYLKTKYQRAPNGASPQAGSEVAHDAEAPLEGTD